MESRFPALFFSLSAIGLLLIYASAGRIEAVAAGIGSVDSTMVGSYVEVAGYVESARFSDDTIFVKLSDGYREIDVVIFSGLKRALGDGAYAIFAKGSIISVRGVVDEYKGVIEIVPNRVSDIRKLAK
ncbi:MAG: hypothetical protein HYS53_01835 [Candidatus Aenigmarchaeota archaeon]|nr:hypothetical protein [Candidatus Aenigmarchaeota archaeon]